MFKQLWFVDKDCQDYILNIIVISVFNFPSSLWFLLVIFQEPSGIALSNSIFICTAASQCTTMQCNAMHCVNATRSAIFVHCAMLRYFSCTEAYWYCNALLKPTQLDLHSISAVHCRFNLLMSFNILKVNLASSINSKWRTNSYESWLYTDALTSFSSS